MELYKLLLITGILVNHSFGSPGFGQSLREVANYGVNIGTVAVDGTKGVINEGNNVRVMHLSPFASPEFRGTVGLQAVPSCLQVIGDYAYCIEPSGQFHIINIANMDFPVISGAADWQDWKTVLWVRRAGDYAYVAGCGGVRIIDIRNKNNPVVLGILPGQCAYGITGDGGYLYVARSAFSIENALIDIYSLADPADPVLVSSGPDLKSGVTHMFNALAVFGDVAYSANASETYVIDISDRSEPRLAGTIPGSAGKTALAVSKGVLHMANWNKTDFHQLASPTAPDYLKTISGITGHDVTQVAALGESSISARDHSLWTTNITGNSVSLTRSLTPNFGSAYSLARKDNTLFVGTGPGIAVMDISDPTNPLLVSQKSSRWATKMAISGSYLYNLSSWGQLEIFNLSNPSSLIPLPNTYSVPAGTYGSYRISITGSAAAVTAGNTLILYDVAANGPLTQRASIILPTDANAADIAGAALYVTMINGELRTYDITNRSSPLLASTRTPFASPRNGAYNVYCKVVGNRLHTLYGRKGYAIFDISSPMSPVLLGKLDIFQQEAESLDVEGNYTYLAPLGWAGDKGLRVLDISNPNTIAQAFTGDATAHVVDVVEHNGYTFYAEQRGGLRVRQALPSPANATDWSLFY